MDPEESIFICWATLLDFTLFLKMYTHTHTHKMTHACNLSTWEAEKRKLLSHPGLHNELQIILGYRVRPCLKYRHKQTNNTKIPPCNSFEILQVIDIFLIADQIIQFPCEDYEITTDIHGILSCDTYAHPFISSS